MPPVGGASSDWLLGGYEITALEPAELVAMATGKPLITCVCVCCESEPNEGAVQWGAKKQSFIKLHTALSETGEWSDPQGGGDTNRDWE